MRDINTETSVLGIDDREMQAGDCIATFMICYGKMHERQYIIVLRCCGICSPAQS